MTKTDDNGSRYLSNVVLGMPERPAGLPGTSSPPV